MRILNVMKNFWERMLDSYMKSFYRKEDKSSIANQLM